MDIDVPIPIAIVFMIFSTRWGWLALGLLLAIGGTIFGFTSHRISYQSIGHGDFTPYVVNGGTDYLQQSNSSTYYIIHESDFSPTFHFSQLTNSSTGFTMIAQSNTENVDVTFTDNTHLSGTGYEIEEISLLDSNGQNAQVFKTSEYNQSPYGFYQNNWLLGSIGIVVGLLITGLALFLGRG